MIFLVNRMGEVNVIDVDFIKVLDQEQLERLFRGCAWCPLWSTAAELSRKRRRALEELRRK